MIQRSKNEFFVHLSLLDCIARDTFCTSFGWSHSHDHVVMIGHICDGQGELYLSIINSLIDVHFKCSPVVWLHLVASSCFNSFCLIASHTFVQCWLHDTGLSHWPDHLVMTGYICDGQGVTLIVNINSFIDVHLVRYSPLEIGSHQLHI